MTAIDVSVDLNAPPTAVWAQIADISTHTDWMADAEAIRFCTDQRNGVGTTFDCDTRVGPLHLTDRMAITRWEPPNPPEQPSGAMGVTHTGVVTGSGVFLLDPLGTDRTRFRWQETLAFPWWMGGPLGAAMAKPVLRAVWRRNLRRLSTLVGGPAA